MDIGSADGTGKSFGDYQTLEAIRHQVIKNEDGVLQLHLPKVGFQCGKVLRIIQNGLFFLVVFIGSILLPIFNESLLAFIPLLVSVIPGYSFPTRFNRANQTKTPEINGQKLTLNLRRPLRPNDSTTFNLSDIQGMEYENEYAQMNKARIKMPRIFIDTARRAISSGAYVVTANDEALLLCRKIRKPKNSWLTIWMNW